VLYKKASDKQKTQKMGSKSSRADKLEGLIAGCIYFACKLRGINRSHQEIATICDIDKSDVSIGTKIFKKIMSKELNLNANTTQYSDFIDRYASHLQLSPSELDIVRETCDNVFRLDILDDCKPWNIVSSCIHFASVIYDFEIDRKDIVTKCGETNEATLRKNFTLLLAKVDDIIV
jgi:transcription initiation factor TFIIB